MAEPPIDPPAWWDPPEDDTPAPPVWHVQGAAGSEDYCHSPDELGQTIALYLAAGESFSITTQ
jgi:hypothetical protein